MCAGGNRVMIASLQQEMTMKQKIVNYTPEQTVKMIQDYLGGITVEAIAEGLGRTTKSVVVKLLWEGVYQKKVYISPIALKPYA